MKPKRRQDSPVDQDAIPVDLRRLAARLAALQEQARALGLFAAGKEDGKGDGSRVGR
jgi:hypothetical protein